MKLRDTNTECQAKEPEPLVIDTCVILVAQTICLHCGRPRFDPWVRKIPWRREWQPTLVFLPGKIHGERSLAVHGAAKSQSELSILMCLNADKQSNWHLIAISDKVR